MDWCSREQSVTFASSVDNARQQQPVERSKGFYNVTLDAKRSVHETKQEILDVTGSGTSCDLMVSDNNVLNNDSQSSSSDFERRASQKRVRLEEQRSQSNSFRITSLDAWCRKSDSSLYSSKMTDPNVVSQSSIESSSSLWRRRQKFQQNSDQSMLCHVCRRPYAPYLSVQKEDQAPPLQRNTLLSYFSSLRKNKAKAANNDDSPNKPRIMMRSSCTALGLDPNYAHQSSCSHCDRSNFCHNCRKHCDECKQIFCSFCLHDSYDDSSSSSTIGNFCVSCSTKRTTNNNQLRRISSFNSDCMEVD
jgi:hypothetical protein